MLTTLNPLIENEILIINFKALNKAASSPSKYRLIKLQTYLLFNLNILVITALTKV